MMTYCTKVGNYLKPQSFAAAAAAAAFLFGHPMLCCSISPDTLTPSIHPRILGYRTVPILPSSIFTAVPLCIVEVIIARETSIPHPPSPIHIRTAGIHPHYFAQSLHHWVQSVLVVLNLAVAHSPTPVAASSGSPRHFSTPHSDSPFSQASNRSANQKKASTAHQPTTLHDVSAP